MTRLRLALALALVGIAAAPAQGATLLRLDGIGPLKLGMARVAALDTGWLGDRSTGCELGGKPYPIVYRFTGARAPAGLSGFAQFERHALTVLTFRRGVRTANGVVAGKTTAAGMVNRYRRSGFRASARYDAIFRGTFVTVRRRSGIQVIGGFAPQGKPVQTLGVPHVPVCE